MKTNATILLIHIVAVHNTTTFHHFNSSTHPFTFPLKMSERHIHVIRERPLQNLYTKYITIL